MKYFLLLLLTSLLPATALGAEPSLKQKLESYKQQYQQTSDDVSASRTALDTCTIEIKSAQSTLQSLKTDKDTERNKLDELRTAAEKIPDIDFTDQINRQNAAVYTAGKKYQSQLEVVKTATEKLNESKTRYAIAIEHEKNIRNSISTLHEQLASTELQTRLQNINKSRQINIAVRETCSLQLTQAACRDQAKIKAERQAAEQGSVVVVESVTEIKNFNMTKDEIKSHVKVRLSDIQITRDNYDLTTDKTGWIVDYAITATATPVMTESMRQDLKAQIIADISGGWSPMQIINQDNNSNTPPFQTEAKRQPVKNKQQNAESFWQP